MKCNIFFIFFILLLISVLEVSQVYSIEPIISGEYFTGEYITVANTTFILIGADSDGTYWNNYSSVIFKNNITKSMFKVYKGKCTNIEYYSYCFNDSYYNWDKKFTWEGSILQPTMIIKIYYYTPEVVLERPESLELEYGRGNIININLSNTGTKDTIVYYDEQIPAEFTVQNCNLCTIMNNKVHAEVYLEDGEKKTISYFLQYFGYNNFSWTANYNYSYDDKLKSETKNIHSSVKLPYTLTESLTRSISKTLGDISTFSINITNTQDFSSINLNLSIRNKVVKNYKDLIQNNDTYIYSGIISAGESKVFSITLDSYLVGEFPIYIDADIRAHNTLFEYKRNHSFNVSLNPLTPSLIVDKNIVDPNDTITLIASLKNTDEYAQYLYVYAYLLPQEEHWTFYKINPGKELILYNKTFPIPEGDDDLYIILQGIYRTTNMQDQTFKLEKIIDVRGREPKKVSQVIDQSNEQQTTQQTEETYTVPDNTSLGSDETVISEKVISNPTDNGTETAGKDDLLTQIINAIDSFIKSIFGKR